MQALLIQLAFVTTCEKKMKKKSIYVRPTEPEEGSQEQMTRMLGTRVNNTSQMSVRKISGPKPRWHVQGMLKMSNGRVSF